MLLTQRDESTNRHEELLVRQLYLACAHMGPVYTVIGVVELHGKTVYSLLATCHIFACLSVF